MLDVKKLFSKMLDFMKITTITPSSISSFITVSSGFTASKLVIKKSGNVLFVHFKLKRSSAWSANSATNIGTINSNYRPTMNTGIVTNSFRGITFAENGQVILTPIVALSANADEDVCMTYLYK